MSLYIRRLVDLRNHQTHTDFVLLYTGLPNSVFSNLWNCMDKFIDNIYFQIAFIRSHICKAAELPFPSWSRHSRTTANCSAILNYDKKRLLAKFVSRGDNILLRSAFVVSSTARSATPGFVEGELIRARRSRAFKPITPVKGYRLEARSAAPIHGSWGRGRQTAARSAHAWIRQQRHTKC